MGIRVTGAPKIFGLGVSKTGTSSLHRGLEVLGFTSCHHVHEGQRGHNLIDRAIGQGQPALTHLSGYDAYGDMELYNHLDTLDREHPGSRYIQTVRRLDTWIDSVAPTRSEGRLEPVSTGRPTTRPRQLGDANAKTSTG